MVGLLQGSKRSLPRRVRKESEKGFPGLSAAGPKKLERESKMTIFQVFFRVFGSFRLEFFDPGAETRGPLFRLFSDFPRGRGLFDPCRRLTITKVNKEKTTQYQKDAPGKKTSRKAAPAQEPANLMIFSPMFQGPLNGGVSNKASATHSVKRHMV